MNQVDPAFVAVHVRLHPQTWHRWISMRAELFGCPGKPCHNLTGNSLQRFSNSYTLTDHSSLGGRFIK